MNAEQLHDAISMLPADLIAQADKVRRTPPAPHRWQRYAAMAASVMLVLSAGVWCAGFLASGGAKEAAAEAPAAMQAAVTEKAESSRENQAAPEESVPMEHAADAAAPETDISAAAGCTGSAVPEITVTGEDGTRTLSGEDRAALARFLAELTFLPENICECIAEITVTVNGEETFRINLEEGFVRGPRGQANLTQAQTDALREIFYPAEEE